MKTIANYRIVEHGIENSQYFQGHGTAFTEYTDCAAALVKSHGQSHREILFLGS